MDFICDLKKNQAGGLTANTCNPNDSGDTDQEDLSSRPVQAKS
jgi:hypothetical protein